MKTWMRMTGGALLAALTTAVHAAPDLFYLQNGLDGRGRCLGAGAVAVTMTACDRAPGQQWIVAQGDGPGHNKLRTAAADDTCLAVHPDAHRNVLAMEACAATDDQQWYIERLSEVPRRMRLTNRATGRTRCLEALQTGFRMTPCGRRQAGHLWRSGTTPDM